MAGLNQQIRVGAQKRVAHDNALAVREQKPSRPPQTLDEAENVVPTAAVEPNNPPPESIQNLIHLKRRRERFNQDRGADGAGLEAEAGFGVFEDVVPEGGFVASLQLGEVKVGLSALLGDQRSVVKQVQPGVEERAAHGRAVDFDMGFFEVPSARAGQEDRGFGVEGVSFSGGGVGEVDVAAPDVVEDDLSVEEVAPCGGEGVFEVGHECHGAGVEGVDGHFAVGRAGDFHAPVEEGRGNGLDAPVALADGAGFGWKVEQFAVLEAALAFFASGEEVAALVSEAAFEVEEEVEGFGWEDAARGGGAFAPDADGGRRFVAGWGGHEGSGQP